MLCGEFFLNDDCDDGTLEKIIVLIYYVAISLSHRFFPPYDHISAPFACRGEIPSLRISASANSTEHSST